MHVNKLGPPLPPLSRLAISRLWLAIADPDQKTVTCNCPGRFIRELGELFEDDLARLAAPPTWLRVQNPLAIRPGLDRGEAAAIALALEVQADRLLIDERDGREAAQLGIKTVGTLAILRDAALAGHLNLPIALDRLKQTSFRAHPALYVRMLRDFIERQRP
ncbi:MAG TPA: hypothetical protein VHQ47_19670 [Phycisphaerae bacterium]|nr:hypothetical protein [Phycisphaerae bacterium]